MYFLFFLIYSTRNTVYIIFVSVLHREIRLHIDRSIQDDRRPNYEYSVTDYLTDLTTVVKSPLVDETNVTTASANDQTFFFFSGWFRVCCFRRLCLTGSADDDTHLVRTARVHYTLPRHNDPSSRPSEDTSFRAKRFKILSFYCFR